MPTHVMRVTPENAMLLWDQLAAMLEYEPGHKATHNAEDIRKMVMAQQAHLWIQWNESTKRVEVANVVQFLNFPRGLFLMCWITVAHDAIIALWDDFYQKMIDWADLNRCVGIIAQGRVGWLRKFPAAKSGGLCMRIDL